MPDTPDRVPDNPTGSDFVKLEDDKKRYVTTTNVDNHLAGITVSKKDLGPGAQIQRLLDEGAIAPAPDVGSKEAQAVPASDEGRFDPALNIGKGPAAPGKETRPGDASKPVGHEDPKKEIGGTVPIFGPKPKT